MQAVEVARRTIEIAARFVAAAANACLHGVTEALTPDIALDAILNDEFAPVNSA
jgi:hypothetical protein